VETGSPLVGQTIEAAGLRQLVGMYLMEIEREGEVIPMVGPEQKLEAGDRLVFVGIVDSVIEIQKLRGLRPATNQVFKLNTPRANRMLFEAVVSDSCRLVGQTIRDGRFRGVYNAVVIAARSHDTSALLPAAGRSPIRWPTRLSSPPARSP
jgi:Trk K+ transport system NAD-binding subunit